MQLFKGGIRYLSGGAASGFHHHEDAPHKATLAHIKVTSVDTSSKASAGNATHRLACCQRAALDQMPRSPAMCSQEQMALLFLSRTWSQRQPFAASLARNKRSRVTTAEGILRMCVGRPGYRGAPEPGVPKQQ